MLLSVSDLPYSHCELFIDDYVLVKEGQSFRPDKVVEEYYYSDIFVEFLCNAASNCSPLSLYPGVEYKIPSQNFIKNFLEVG